MKVKDVWLKSSTLLGSRSLSQEKQNLNFRDFLKIHFKVDVVFQTDHKMVSVNVFSY